jgi:hypothetical protein
MRGLLPFRPQDVFPEIALRASAMEGTQVPLIISIPTALSEGSMVITLLLSRQADYEGGSVMKGS